MLALIVFFTFKINLLVVQNFIYSVNSLHRQIKKWKETTIFKNCTLLPRLLTIHSRIDSDVALLREGTFFIRRGVGGVGQGFGREVIGKYFTNRGVKPVLYATGEGSKFFCRLVDSCLLTNKQSV